MRVLVTGGTGYLGAAVVRALHAGGHHPVVFSRQATAAALPGTPFDADIRDLTAVRRAAESVDAFIPTAALVSLWRPRPQEFDEVNVGGLANVIDVARERGVRRIVYTSSFLALPPAGLNRPLDANDYQRTNRIARDRALNALASGAPLVILYPGVVYGPGPATEGNLVGRLLRDQAQGRLPGIVGSGRQWSLAFIDDIADLHVRAVERTEAAGEYQAGGENVPQMRIFEIAREVTGRPLPRRIPSGVARVAGALEEMRTKLTGRPPRLTRGAVRIFLHDWPLDSGRSARELNYRVTPLAWGIRTTLASLG
jgi:farnesol dehydrogenase